MTSGRTLLAGNADYARGLARAAAGAVIFGFPMMMTMELWELGFHMDRLRLALFVCAMAAVVFGLSVFAGFRDVNDLFDDVLDAFAAVAVGFGVSAVMLAIFGLLTAEMTMGEWVGKIAVQAGPAAIGAILANKQLNGPGAVERKREGDAGYVSELFLMGAGALFLALNVAPTEEMVLIGYRMSAWHALGLVALSIGALHALVCTVGFAGHEAQEKPLLAFFHFTLAGYGLALAVSVYALWTFGRLDDVGLNEVVRSAVVLGFPAALGAALARLLV